jgi:LPXTG-motif cell wall-anchored protein
MRYVCEDPNDALQRRLTEDMDTCAYTHFGMLEKTGAIEAPRAEEPLVPAPRAVGAVEARAVEERAVAEPKREFEPAYALIGLAILVAIAAFLYVRRKRGHAAR